MELTAAGVDDTTPVTRGDTASFTLTITNPGKETVRFVQVAPFGDGDLQTEAIGCTAHKGTCPTITDTFPPTFDMPPGSVFTFVVQAQVLGDPDGPVKMTLAVDSFQRIGEVRAVAQATSVDRRDGAYAVLPTAGLRADLVVDFTPGATRFSEDAGSIDKTFQTNGFWSTLPSGGRRPGLHGDRQRGQRHVHLPGRALRRVADLPARARRTIGRRVRDRLRQRHVPGRRCCSRARCRCPAR